MQFFSGTAVILALELRQRVRTVSWYVLIGVFVALVAIVTFFTTIAFEGFGVDGDNGGVVFSVIIYVVLLLGTLVAPALSGNAINGDRDAGTLATTQVTLVTTWQLIIGKFLAAWIMALTFLAAAIPFLIWAASLGGLGTDTIVVSVLVVAFELAVIAAIGVGLSGLIPRPLFSIVLSYLVVAALSLGTVITFSIGTLVDRVEVHTVYYSATEWDDKNGIGTACTREESTYDSPRSDRLWGVLAVNPYVLLADAVPTYYTPDGYPADMFGNIKLGLRYAQQAPQTEVVYNDCAAPVDEMLDAREIMESTVPSWPVGLAVHLVLAVAALVGAWTRVRTPAGRLSRGSRVA